MAVDDPNGEPAPARQVPAAEGDDPRQPAAVGGPTDVSQDMPCLGCGYNLRGLRSDGRCPECGKPVRHTLDGDLLNLGPRAYLRKLRRGALLLLIGFVASGLNGGVAVLYSGVSLAVILSGPLPYGVFDLGELHKIMRAVSPAQTAVLLLGAWLVTASEPGGPGSLRKWRVLCRSGLTAALVVSVVSARLSSALARTVAPPQLYTLNLVAHLVGTTVYILGLFSLLTYLAHIAMRIRDPRLAGRTGIVKWGFTATASLIVVSYLLTLMMWYSSSFRTGITLAGEPILKWTVWTTSLLSMIGMLAFNIWVLVLLFRYRRRLKRQGRPVHDV